MDEILKELVDAIEVNNDSIESILLKVAKEKGLSDEELAEIQESFDTLTSINSKAIELDEARVNQITRDKWITSQLNSISENNPEKADDIFLEIKKGIDEGLENLDNDN